MSSSRRNILYLFDVDGTLTKHRCVIGEQLKDYLLNIVSTEASIGVVSGSDYPKICEQMGGEEVLSRVHYVFCENGLVYYKNGKFQNKESILSHLGERKLQHLINFALSYMSKLELPAKRGNFVEFRSSMINLCPVGRSCSREEREQFAHYDSQHGVRKEMIRALEEEFQELGLKFALGGQISVDVFPVGWDKTYCLNHVKDNNFEEIHFFGDRTFPGGNDYEIFNDERTIGHTVTSPEDTLKQIQLYLGLS